MLSHDGIWNAIDELAQRHGLSPSGLARLAGLDSTAFNRSKRVSKDGRARWPSTESIFKILHATGEDPSSFLDFGRGYTQDDAEVASVPLLGFAQAGAGGYFDASGFPVGQGWDEIPLPHAGDGTFALEVTGDSMEPMYRDGDYLIISPSEQLRRGDRVVLKTRGGEVMAKILYRQTPRHVELHSLNPEHAPRTFLSHEIDWIGRIIWASQ